MRPLRRSLRPPLSVARVVYWLGESGTVLHIRHLAPPRPCCTYIRRRRSDSRLRRARLLTIVLPYLQITHPEMTSCCPPLPETELLRVSSCRTTGFLSWLSAQSPLGIPVNNETGPGPSRPMQSQPPVTWLCAKLPDICSVGGEWRRKTAPGMRVAMIAMCCVVIVPLSIFWYCRTRNILINQTTNERYNHRCACMRKRYLSHAACMCTMIMCA